MFNVLGKLATPAIKIYATVSELRQMIKENNLDNKLDLAIKNVKAKKESNNNSNNDNEEYDNERIGLGNSKTEKNIVNVNNLSKNKHKFNRENTMLNDKHNTNTNIKNNIDDINKNPVDIFYHDSKEKSELKNQEQKYKNELLDILGDKATNADILYAKPEELEKKIREYGLDDRLKGIITGGASNTGIQETKQKVKLLPKIKLGNSQTVLKGGISHDEIKTDSNIKPVSNVISNSNKNWNTDEGFRKAMPHLFSYEGKYINDPIDRGGETKYGITKDTLNVYKSKHNNFKNIEIKNLTKEQAAQIYYDEYWKKSGADKIKDKDLAYVHFDATVNHGLKNSRKFLEQSGGDFDKYIEIRRKFYGDIVKNRPSQEKFYKGWMNRLDNIKKNKGNY